jgi:tape measure domain-containing protein
MTVYVDFEVRDANVRSSVDNINKSITRLASSTGKTSNNMVKLDSTNLNHLNKQLSSINNNITKISTSSTEAISKMKTLAVSVGAAITGAFAGTAFTRAGDSVTNINNRLALIVGRGKELNEVRLQLEKISRISKTSVYTGQEVFSRMGMALKGKFPTTDLLKATEAIQLAAKIGGGSAESVDAALIQLSQAFSGNFRNAGAELMSLQEQAPKVAMAIADGLGIAYGDLRTYAADGKLSTDLVMKALINQLGSLRKESASMEGTVGSSFMVLGESVTRFFGEVNRGMGTNKRLVNTIDELAFSFYYLARFVAKDVSIVVDHVLDFFSKIYNSAKLFYNNFGKPIVDTFKKLVASVYAVSLDIWSRIEKPIADFIGRLKTLFWDFYIWLVGNSVWPDTWDEVVLLVKNLWPRIQGGISTFFAKIKGAFLRFQDFAIVALATVFNFVDSIDFETLVKKFEEFTGYISEINFNKYFALAVLGLATVFSTTLRAVLITNIKRSLLIASTFLLDFSFIQGVAISFANGLTDYLYDALIGESKKISNNAMSKIMEGMFLKAEGDSERLIPRLSKSFGNLINAVGVGVGGTLIPSIFTNLSTAEAENAVKRFATPIGTAIALGLLAIMSSSFRKYSSTFLAFVFNVGEAGMYKRINEHVGNIGTFYKRAITASLALAAGYNLGAIISDQLQLGQGSVLDIATKLGTAIGVTIMQDAVVGMAEGKDKGTFAHSLKRIVIASLVGFSLGSFASDLLIKPLLESMTNAPLSANAAKYTDIAASVLTGVAYFFGEPLANNTYEYLKKQGSAAMSRMTGAIGSGMKKRTGQGTLMRDLGVSLGFGYLSYTIASNMIAESNIALSPMQEAGVYIGTALAGELFAMIAKSLLKKIPANLVQNLAKSFIARIKKLFGKSFGRGAFAGLFVGLFAVISSDIEGELNSLVGDLIGIKIEPRSWQAQGVFFGSIIVFGLVGGIVSALGALATTLVTAIGTSIVTAIAGVAATTFVTIGAVIGGVVLQTMSKGLTGKGIIESFIPVGYEWIGKILDVIATAALALILIGFGWPVVVIAAIGLAIWQALQSYDIIDQAAINTFFQNIWDAITSSVDAIIGAGKSIWEYILDFKGLSFTEMGAKIARDIFKGLTSLGATIKDWFKSLFNIQVGLNWNQETQQISAQMNDVFGGPTPQERAATHRATGGYISGPGTGTSDSIPAMLSNGEYVINAQATKKFGPLLQKINSGTYGKFAAGYTPGSTTSGYTPGESTTRSSADPQNFVEAVMALWNGTASKETEAAALAQKQLNEANKESTVVTKALSKEAQAAADKLKETKDALKDISKSLVDMTTMDVVYFAKVGQAGAESMLTSFQENVNGLLTGELSFSGALDGLLNTFTNQMITSFSNSLVSSLFNKFDLTSVFGSLFSGSANLGAKAGGGVLAPNAAGLIMGGTPVYVVNSGAGGLGGIPDATSPTGPASAAAPGGVGGFFTSMISGFKSMFSGLFSSLSGMLSNVFSMFGGGGGGLGSIFSLFTGGGGGANLTRRATGGKISGPGSGTSDSIMAMLSNGEYIVNAATTKKWLPFLEQINANNGKLPAFAKGGSVGAANPSAMKTVHTNNPKAKQQQTFNINITGDVGMQTRKEIARMIPEITSGVNMTNRERGSR